MYNSLWETTTGREKAGKRRKNMEPNLEKRSRANTDGRTNTEKKTGLWFFFFLFLSDTIIFRTQAATTRHDQHQVVVVYNG